MPRLIRSSDLGHAPANQPGERPAGLAIAVLDVGKLAHAAGGLVVNRGYVIAPTGADQRDHHRLNHEQLLAIAHVGPQMIEDGLAVGQPPLMHQAIEWARPGQQQAFLHITELDEGPGQGKLCRACAGNDRVPPADLNNPGEITFLSRQRHFDLNRGAGIGGTQPFDISVGLVPIAPCDRPLGNDLDRPPPQWIELQRPTDRLFVRFEVTGIAGGEP